MDQFKFCRICLVTDVTMYSLVIKSKDSLGFIYSQLTEIHICDRCQHVCFECASLLRKYHMFKLKSHRAHRILAKISDTTTAMTKEMINKVDRKENNLESNLVFSQTCCYEPDKDLTNRYTRIDKEIFNKVKDNVALKVKSEDSDHYDDANFMDENQDLKEKCFTPEKTDPNQNKETLKKYASKKINVIYGYQDTETHSTLDLIKSSLDDFENDDMIEYLDENILVEVEESVFETFKANVIEKPKIIKLYPKISKPDTETSKPNPEMSKPMCNISKSNPKISKPNPKMSKPKNIRDNDFKIKKRSCKTVYKKTEKIRKKYRIDWNLEFDGYGTVVPLTRDDAIREFLKRKESKNYTLLPFKCELCYKGFEGKYTYGNHMKLHNPEIGEYECDICHLWFSKRRCLRGHMMKTHTKKFICKLCPYISFCTHRARIHVSLHKGKKYPCTECRAIFCMPNSLVMHKRLKHLKNSVTEFVCDICGNIFATCKGLYLHQNRLHKTDKIKKDGPKCEECGVDFASENAWSRHLVLSTRHTKLSVNNACKDCGERFADANELRQHIRANHLRLPFIKRLIKINTGPCKECGQSMSDWNELSRHMREVHSMDVTRRGRRVTSNRGQPSAAASYVCEMCGLAFKYQRRLEEHQRTHTGERPFKCEDCNKTYISAGVLYMHRKKHTDIKYNCDICGKLFVSKSSLSKHIKMHMGIRPHKCLVCSKAFPHKCELQLHVKYVHEKVPWPKRIRKRNVNNNNHCTGAVESNDSIS